MQLQCISSEFHFSKRGEWVMRVNQRRLLALTAAGGMAAALGSFCPVPAQAAGPLVASAQFPLPPIHHVVEIMRENHTFDNLFGNFLSGGSIPKGVALPNPDQLGPVCHPD